MTPLGPKPDRSTTATPDTLRSGTGAPTPGARTRVARRREPAAPRRAEQDASAVLRLPEAPLPPAEVDRLVSGVHHDPHALLGAHATLEGTAIRVLRPFAERVVVETDHGPAELTHQQSGLFTGLLAGREFPAYRLRVTYPGGGPLLQDDGYRMAPTLGELDLHLIAEGRHEQLWRALGSHVRTVDGVAG
ncbi:GlgB N-terminal domain-containing protein, partial [Kitasatospora sp. NE20-6]|uniref:GlgB N-terminal domain-containing protein n=1 Tax=Kitasatospora sp. NE20-6 TaxID=2859066 RepID=UPI0038B23F62